MSDKPKVDESFVDYANQLVKKYLNDDDKKLQKSINTNVSQVIDTNFSAFEPTPLVKSILKTLDRQDEEVERLAFEVDPTQNAQYKSIWEPKTNLIPDVLLKRISVTDDLVATIVLTRENQISRFGRPRPDRLSTGYVIEPRPETVESIKKEKNHKIRHQKKEKLRKRIAEVTNLLYTCGPTEGWSKRDQLTFTQYIKESVRSVLTVGRLATEICHKPGLNGEYKFAGFRVIDAGTIYRAVPGNKSTPELRKQAIFQLQQLKNKRIDYRRFAADEYKWIQVVKDKPVNAFTDEECIVHDFYSVPDIEANGYPLTPIDTMIAAVTTHINITTSNKLYFENGRSSKGFIVLQSDNVSESQLARIKQAFNSSINNVRNSHRTPLFGVGADDSITWTPTDTSSRDMEFQYLSDMNARIILSAFQISPDELPGYTYLSKGMNQQSLCLHPESKIYVPEGMVSIASILNDKESLETRVWTGEKWTEATIFKTSEKEINETLLDNGISILTSPDHRFKVIGPDGEPIWKVQKDLEIGEFVLINKKPIIGINDIPSYNGKKITLELMEVLGWMTGDGCISAQANHSFGIKLFYHHSKEVDIWERHSKILSDFGLNPRQEKKEISKEEVENIKLRYGFKSVSNIRIYNILNDKVFINWLLGLGFKSSANGKEIPSFVHTLPEEYRSAYLKGFFSADGGRNATCSSSVIMTIQSDKLRKQTKDLLLGLGIRTRFSEGTTKQIFIGDKRETVITKNKLYIKDKRLFYNKIGFLQEHKQASAFDLEGNEVSQKIPLSTQKKYIKLLIESDLPRAYKRNIYSDNIRFTLPRIKFLLTKAKILIPDWMDNFHAEEIVGLTSTQDKINMVDITVHDENHSFIANGFLVHNSESNSEFKLTAARDAGLIPLMAQFEDFINQQILPNLDPVIAKLCVFKMVGLNSNTAEKDALRLQEDMALHLTFDEIMSKVEKNPVGKRFGGEVPLNPNYQQVLDKYLTVGEILEKFLGVKNASKNPSLCYMRDQYWFQWQQLRLQKNQLDKNSQMQEQQLQQQAQQEQMQQQQTEAPVENSGDKEFHNVIDEGLQSLNKAEAHKVHHRKRLEYQKNNIIHKALRAWEKDIQELNDSIIKELKKI